MKFSFSINLYLRALCSARINSKKFDSMLKTSFFGVLGNGGGISIFSSILIKSQWFKMIIYYTYIVVFILKDFILEHALLTHINDFTLPWLCALIGHLGFCSEKSMSGG